MTKDQFKANLNESTSQLIGLTGTLCYNSFSPRYRFVVRMNTETIDPHLNQEEILFSRLMKTFRNKYLSDQEVIDLLCRNNKVPLWINTSVWEVTDKWTTIELVISRRLRNENELNKLADRFPPFHIGVPLPAGRTEGVRFDVNWRASNKKKQGLWAKIKAVLG